MTPWSVRYYRDELLRLPVAEFFVMPSEMGITMAERVKFLARLDLVRAFGLTLIARNSDVLESLRGETNLYSIRLNRTPNNPRILACALTDQRCIVLLHAFKELGKNAYLHELPKGRTRRDRVVHDPTRWVDPS